MSNLSYETLLSGLRHDDIFVRSGILLFLAESGTECDVDASHVVLDALEKHGWYDAFAQHAYMSTLPIDRKVAERLCERISAGAEPATGFVKPCDIFFDWLSHASADVSRSIFDKFETFADKSDTGRQTVSLARFKISLLDQDVEACRATLEKLFDSPDENIGKIKAAVARLHELEGIDPDEVNKWINVDSDFEDEFNLTREECYICAGFEMAAAAKIRVPLERCLTCLDHEIDWLSDAVVAAMTATANEALLDDLISRYSKADSEEREEFLLIFEKVRFPGHEEKFLDLAALEKDLGLRAHLAIVTSFYTSDRGLKCSRQIFEGMAEEIEASDIVDVLYPLRILNGDTSADLDDWRVMLQEIHTTTLKMFAGEIDITDYIQAE